MENVGKMHKVNPTSVSPKYGGTLPAPKVSPYGQRVLVSEPVNEPTLSFSFRYFSQDKFFGLRDECDGAWFVSFLNTIQELCDHTYSEFMANKPLQNKFRFHRVDFTQDNVSISRASIKSVPENIRNNDREFPFFELNVTRSRGRFFGFFDRCVFNVVYLDRFHNMYPMDRGITRTFECESHYDALLGKLRTIVNKVSRCTYSECEIDSMLENIPGLESHIIYIALGEKDLDTLLELQKNHSWEEIFEAGMFHYLDERS